jgi:hypothetical protein
MGYNTRDFAVASDESVKEDLREGYWLVYRHYCVVDPAEGVVRCTRGLDPGLVKELNPQVRQHGEVSVVHHPQSAKVYGPGLYARGPYVVAPFLLKNVNELTAEEVKRDPDVFREYVNSVDYYSPLSYPDMFLEFAGLADGGEITLGVMLEWVEQYGVLGFEERESRDIDPQEPDLMGGPYDSLLGFDYEARMANAVLRLYEAATDPKGVDVEGIKRCEGWLSTEAVLREYGHRMDTSAGLRDAALGWVAGTVRRKVAEDCYPELYQEAHTFRSGYGFKSLVGAMYLQMMWLMTATGEIRLCQGPGCNKVIAFEPPEPPKDPGLRKNARGRYRTRKDKRFCSDNCRVKHHQQVKRRAARLQ